MDQTEKIFKLISKEVAGIFQDDLNKKIDISDKELTKILTKLEKKNLVNKEKIKGEQTYKIFPKEKYVAMGITNDVYCYICEYETSCNQDSTKYLEVCSYIEDWSIKQHKQNMK